ncbi:MAG: DUF4227 family protein [Bacillaceae bacterium]|nr:DUF4227 family protein [Bacillaceae bacterium]
MIISIKKLWEGLKLLLLFIVFTLIFYSIVSFFAEVIQPSDPYRKPEGRAVKVDGEAIEEQANSEWETFKQRLMLFYWYGE